MKKFHLPFLFALIPVFGLAPIVLAEDAAPSSSGAKAVPDRPSLISAMAGVYAAYRELYPLIFSETEFKKSENEAHIKNLLLRLKDGFHQAERAGRFGSDPSFAAAVDKVNEEIAEAGKRFGSGGKDMALFGLRHVSQLCIGCHTTHAVTVKFKGSEAPVAGLTALERAEFFLATREFGRARKGFLEASNTVNDELSQASALRGWLRIVTRTDSDPKQALKELQQISLSGTLKPESAKLVANWTDGLNAWAKEEQNEDSLAKASALIGPDLVFPDRSRSLDVLRGTGILHRLLEKSPQTKSKAQIFYLLGLGYAKAPEDWTEELPKVFLEEVISEQRGSALAMNAFVAYEKIMAIDLQTGTGRSLSDEDKLTLRELKDIASGRISMQDRI